MKTGEQIIPVAWTAWHDSQHQSSEELSRSSGDDFLQI